MKGFLIYCKNDYEKNKTFAKWLSDECQKEGMKLELLFREDFYAFRPDIRPDEFVINRSRDYNLSLTLELAGVRVFNNSKITLIGNNKLAAYSFAQNKNYAYPSVLVSPSRDEKTLMKPIDGHGGEGIALVDQDTVFKKEYLYQEFLRDIVGDIRFYILGDRIHDAVLRKSVHGIQSNYSLGNDFERYAFSLSEEKYILSFIDGLNIDYAGADFFLKKDGSLVFNEMEDVVGSRMLSALGTNCTARLLANLIAREMKK